MSTATPNRTVAQDHARIRSPLERLRGYIRSYVTLEGIGLALLFLCTWFWVGMLLDWGFFKLLGVDIVQHWPWAFRAVVLVGLCGLLVTLLIFTILFRLLVQFNDKAMAQVLEHRFPDLLGDRLITAVELNNPEEAAKYGYSLAMVRQTIQDAAEQVEKVPVKEVFNWGRLVRRAIWIGVLSVGLYLLVGLAVTTLGGYVYGYGPKRSVEAPGFVDVNETATIWAERNLLLRNTIWPRRAHLVVSDFPEGLRIPKKSTPPPLRVKAWKFVVADTAQKEGWRQMAWEDVGTYAGEVPGLPADWNANAETTTDEVETKLDAFPIRTSLPGGATLPARWCIATADAEYEGWKPLLWSDLTSEKLGGLAVPTLPGEWDPRARVAAGLGALAPNPLGGAAIPLVGPKAGSLSIDEVEKKLAESPADAKGLDAIRMVFARLNRLNEIRQAMDTVDARATDRANKRTIRRLRVPAEVRLVYWSRTRTNEIRLDAIGDNQFIGNFGELDEDVSFSVRGEDYITPPRTIVVVDRPQIERLESEEMRPAYLYYRPGIDGKSPTEMELMGQRQPFQPVPVSISGETTTIEPMVGTKLRLVGHFTKPIVSASGFETIKDKEVKLFDAAPRDDEQSGGHRQFASPDMEVRREIKLTLRFTDVDGVAAERKVILAPRPDAAPTIRDFTPEEVIRRDKVGYMITSNARVPFRGRVTDDLGLGQVSFGVRVIPSDFLSEQKIRSLDGIAAIGMASGRWGLLTQSVPWLIKVRKDTLSASGEELIEEQSLPLPELGRTVRNNRQPDGSSEYLSLETIQTRLQSPQREPYRMLLKTFVMSPDKWDEQDELISDNPKRTVERWTRPDDREKALLGTDLGVWQLSWKDREGKKQPLKDPDDTKPQKRFNVEVRLLAEDLHLEGEKDPKTKRPIPHSTASSETFTFVVVPENELLAKIGEEEEQKYRDLLKAFKPLPEGLDRLRDISFALSGDVMATDLVAFTARCDSLSEVLRTSEQETKGVKQAYDRIVREMRLNQVRMDMQVKVYANIAVPLTKIVDIQFKASIESLDELRKKLAQADAPKAEREKAASAARKELNDLVSALNGVLAAMEGINTINNLIAELARIEKQEEDLEALVKKIRAEELKKLLKD